MMPCRASQERRSDVCARSGRRLDQALRLTTTAPKGSLRASGAHQVMAAYGQSMTRTGAIYAVGMASIVPLGLLSVAVTTRYLQPADYGRLAILFAVASVLTIFCGLGIFQGGMMAAYGGADDGADEAGGVEGDGGHDVRGGPSGIAAERRRLLSSGLAYGAIATAALCVPVMVLSGEIAAIVGDTALQSAIAWMAASACFGAVWRSVHQVYRFERRPIAWSLLQFLRPTLVVALTTWALARGFGISGVLAATAIGTGLACVGSLIGSRDCLSLHPRPGDLRLIWGYGRQWIPLNLAFAFQSNASVLLLAFIAPTSAVGLFQVANRIGSIPSYLADGFLAGWAPMQRSPVALAAHARKGVREASASLFTLVAVGTLLALMVVVSASSVLILIAAPAYGAARDLIPLMAAAHVANASLKGIYRATSFPTRRAWYVGLHFVWVVPYLGSVLVTGALAPTYSVGAAILFAGIAVTSVMVIVDRRGPSPTPFAWGRLARLTSLVGVVGAAFAFSIFGTLTSIAAIGIVFVGLPRVLTIARVVTPVQAATLATIGSTWLKLGGARSRLRQRLLSLPRNERTAVDLLALGNTTAEEASAATGVAVPVLFARMVRGLRRVSGQPDQTPEDASIGAYLLLDRSTLERDVHVTALQRQGVDPYELHVLEDLLNRVRVACRCNEKRIPLSERSHAATHALASDGS